MALDFELVGVLGDLVDPPLLVLAVQLELVEIDVRLLIAYPLKDSLYKQGKLKFK